ncbi:MAG: M14 family zinc carboxypeptidase, partial [Oscillospiraceae bacterium]
RMCNFFEKNEKAISINMKNFSFLNNGVVFIPTLNPDGVDIAIKGVNSAGEFSGIVKKAMKKDERSWQANARGVDLNHNFDAGYDKLKNIEISSGITGASPRQYGGEFAHSEPETKAIIDFLNKINPRAVFAFHSQGEEIFYEYGDNTPTISYFVAELYRKLSGYKLVKNDSLYSHGGLKDYCIEKLKIPSFTIEIGKGENPLPIDDLFPIYDKIRKMLVAMITL